MGDRSRFGLAKSMFSDGPEFELPDDPDALAAFVRKRMDEFNALPFEERMARTQSLSEPATPPVAIPYLPPSEAELEASARRAPVLAHFEALCEFLGPKGRVLTAKGNLKLADGRQLVDILETGEVFDPPWGKRTSTLDLARLSMMVEWAQGAGAVRKVHNRLIPVKAWASRPAVDRMVQAAELLLGIGPISWLRGGWGTELDSFLDGGIPHWLAPPLTGQETEVTDIIGLTLDTVEASAIPTGVFDMRPWIARDVVASLELVEEAGLIEWVRWAPVENDFGSDREGGIVRITALGRHVLPARMDAAGLRAVPIPDVVDLDAPVLVGVVADGGVDPDVVTGRWWPDRSVGDRAMALAGALLEATSAKHRAAGFGLLRSLGPDGVEGALRTLLDTTLDGHAASLLIDLELADPDELVDHLGGAGLLIDMLSLVVDDPDELTFVFLQDPDVAPSIIEGLWRWPQPETAIVLEALGRQLPRDLAKLARKALVRHRSWMASRS